jgi:hypothetical protein
VCGTVLALIAAAADQHFESTYYQPIPARLLKTLHGPARRWGTELFVDPRLIAPPPIDSADRRAPLGWNKTNVSTAAPSPLRNSSFNFA